MTLRAEGMLALKIIGISSASSEVGEYDDDGWNVSCDSVSFCDDQKPGAS